MPKSPDQSTFAPDLCPFEDVGQSVFEDWVQSGSVGIDSSWAETGLQSPPASYCGLEPVLQQSTRDEECTLGGIWSCSSNGFLSQPVVQQISPEEPWTKPCLTAPRYPQAVSWCSAVPMIPYTDSNLLDDPQTYAQVASTWKQGAMLPCFHQVEELRSTSSTPMTRNCSFDEAQRRSSHSSSEEEDEAQRRCSHSSSEEEDEAQRRCSHSSSEEEDDSPFISNSSHSSTESSASSGIRYACTTCRQIFKSSYLLELHARAKGHRVYVCREPGCQRSYCRRDTYRRHRATCHGPAEVHVCPYCRPNERHRSFKRKDHLSQHIRNRHPQYDSGCDEATFDQSPRLHHNAFGRMIDANDGALSTQGPPSGVDAKSATYCHDLTCSRRKNWELFNEMVGGDNKTIETMEQGLPFEKSPDMASFIAKLTLLNPNNLSSCAKAHLEDLAFGAF